MWNTGSMHHEPEGAKVLQIVAAKAWLATIDQGIVHTTNNDLNQPVVVVNVIYEKTSVVSYIAKSQTETFH